MLHFSNENFINGEWKGSASGQRFENINPSNEQVLETYPMSNQSDMELAIESAAASFPRWRKYPAPRRAEILFRAGELMVLHKEELCRGVAQEMGKNLEDSRGDIQESIDLCYYFAGEGRRLFGLTTPSESPDKMILSYRAPLGVVGAISPFNFPFAIPALKSLPAIASGNTVVLKPATDTPRSSNMLAAILAEAGLPNGVFNVVHGSGSDVGMQLVNHPKVPLISFTGSKQVGIEITKASAPYLKKVILELGGKNCIIVMDDANLQEAVTGILWSAFGTTGQRCTAASRVIAHRSIHDDLVEQLRQQMHHINMGSPLDSSTQLGPLINRAAVDRTSSYVEIGKREGAELVAGGSRVDRPGFFYAPTLFAGATSHMRISQEEIFGPVTAVMKAQDIEDAIRLANDIEYGLSASIYTQDISKALHAAHNVETGLFYVNAGTIGAEAHLPTGGMKASGNGHREASIAALDSYTEWRSLYIDYSHRLQRAQIDIDIPY